MEFDPSMTQIDLTSKGYMDGALPMRNGRICEQDSSPDAEESPTHQNGGKGETSITNSK